MSTDFEGLRIIYRLKNVSRLNSVQTRKESSAEHSWSSLILADYMLTKFPRAVDRLKVYELLMYHDVVEIEAGDTQLHPRMISSDKTERENLAALLLKDKISNPLNTKYYTLFVEYRDQKTIESRYAHAIDSLDAIIHELDYKQDWAGWSEQFLRDKKGKYFTEFDELRELFEETIQYMTENKYIS